MNSFFSGEPRYKMGGFFCLGCGPVENYLTTDESRQFSATESQILFAEGLSREVPLFFFWKMQLREPSPIHSTNANTKTLMFFVL